MAWAGLGSNQGDRLAWLAAAARSLKELSGVREILFSPLYLSSPVGVRRQPWFLNCAARMLTRLTPERILWCLLAIEARLGRRRTRRGGPRSVDLDLLMHGANVRTTARLTVPHARLHERAFVITPCCALDPEIRHPVLDVRLAELASGLRRGQVVRRLPPRDQDRFSRLVRKQT